MVSIIDIDIDILQEEQLLELKRLTIETLDYYKKLIQNDKFEEAKNNIKNKENEYFINFSWNNIDRSMTEVLDKMIQLRDNINKKL